MGDLTGLMNSLLLLLLFGAGGYALFTAIKLKVKGYLFPNKFMYPGNCSPEECTDEVGFMRYMLPRMFILGLACVATGIVYAINAYVGLGLPAWLGDYVLPFVGVFVFFWFIMVQSKAAKRFW